MSLRRTIFLAVALAVLVTTVVEGVLDVIVDRYITQQRLFFDLIDIPLMLALAAVIAWLVARRIARPLRNLSQATRQVAEQTFPAALEVPPGNDELTELAASFNAMTSAVQGFVERERTFTRYASHELRTPLSAMRLQIERAELGHVDAAAVLPALRRNVAKLEEILSALLALARLPDQQVEQELLAPLLVESLAALPEGERGRVTVREAVPAEIRVTHGRLFQQAMANIVENALRHGSGTATVELNASDTAVTLRVNDDGPGLAEPDLERVIEPFYRAKNHAPPSTGSLPHERDTSEAGNHDGNGLGLAFVAFIARALNGELTLQNSNGGLEAVLTLPIVAGR